MGRRDGMQLDHLEISSPEGCGSLQERDIDIKAGERVLIVGDRGTGKTLLFRHTRGALAVGIRAALRARAGEADAVSAAPCLHSLRHAA